MARGNRTLNHEIESLVSCYCAIACAFWSHIVFDCQHKVFLQLNYFPLLVFVYWLQLCFSFSWLCNQTNVWLLFFSNLACAMCRPYQFKYTWVVNALNVLQLAHLFACCLGQETTKWPLRSSCQVPTCYCQSNHSRGRGILLIALPKSTTIKLASLSSHYPFLMLNVKQESCEYQL